MSASGADWGGGASFSSATRQLLSNRVLSESVIPVFDMSLSAGLRRSSNMFLSGSSSRSLPLPFGGIRRRTTSGCAAGERRRMRLRGRGVGCSILRFGGFFIR